MADLNFLLNSTLGKGNNPTEALEREVMRQKRELYAVLSAMERRISRLEAALDATQQTNGESNE